MTGLLYSDQRYNDEAGYSLSAPGRLGHLNVFYGFELCWLFVLIPDTHISIIICPAEKKNLCIVCELPEEKLVNREREE